MYNFLGNSLSLLPYLESEMMIKKKMKVEEKEKEKEKLINRTLHSFRSDFRRYQIHYLA